jgi:predicted PurR-regulated permease PerM
VGGYIRSELVQSVLAGLMLGLGYYIMGLDFPALIALIGALLWLVPWLGAILAMVLPLIIGLTSGIGLAIAAPIFTVVVLAFLEIVVEPYIFNQKRYSSLLVVILLVALAETLGLVGMLIAPPLAAAVQVIFTGLIRPTAPIDQSGITTRVQSLRQRAVDLQEQIAHTDKLYSPEVVNLLGRLNKMIEQTEHFYKGEATTSPGNQS